MNPEDDQFHEVYNENKKEDYHTSIAMSDEDDDHVFSVPALPNRKKKKKSRWGPKNEKEVPGFRRAPHDSYKTKKFPGPRVPSQYKGVHLFTDSTIVLAPQTAFKAMNLSVHDRSSWQVMSLEDK
eukprot:UN33895